jgi:LysM repeat protein
MSKDDRKKRNHTQNQILTSFGCLFVAAVGVFSASGAKFAINAINRDATDTIVLAQQSRQFKPQLQQSEPSKITTSESEETSEDAVKSNTTEQSNTDKPDDTKWSDVQVKWMQENHITYNENGQPVDEDGNVVTDPTITANSDSSESLESTLMEPETNTSWASGMDWLTQQDDGNYVYVVQKGDCLNDICARTGFALNEVVAYNHIDNPNIIHVGERIVFPKDGPNTVDYPLGLG